MQDFFEDLAELDDVALSSARGTRGEDLVDERLRPRGGPKDFLEVFLGDDTA